MTLEVVSPPHWPAGFADPVHDAQRVFRAYLSALSHPGKAVQVCEVAGPRFSPYHPATTALLLALADETTPVWWQDVGHRQADALRFHTGAPQTESPAEAAFAVIGRPLQMPALDAFAPGSDAFPERSTTVVIEVADLEDGPRFAATGPGINGEIDIAVRGLPPDFASQWQRNHAAFPCGVDLILTTATHALGLPRTTRLQGRHQ